MSHTLGIQLRGTGSSLPETVLHNQNFPASLDTSDEWIRTRTGIRERRICRPDETTSSLGLQASRRALEAAGLGGDELDLIVCATTTPDMLVPATACLIQGQLGCRPIPAFDLNAACTGFIYGLAVATSFLQTGAARHALVVGGDTLSRIVDFSDRTTCILFGDGAGAVVVSAVAGAPLPSFHLHADGTRHDVIRANGVALRTPASAPARPVSPDYFDYLRMNGREVFKFAVRAICELIDGSLADADLRLADIDLIVPHQVNQRILDAAFAELDFPMEKLVVNLDRYGNTAAASVPIALDEAMRSGRLRPGDTVLMLAFGGGLTWASAVWTV